MKEPVVFTEMRQFLNDDGHVEVIVKDASGNEAFHGVSSAPVKTFDDGVRLEAH